MRSLTRRQLAGSAVAGGFAAGVVVAGLLNQLPLAVALLGAAGGFLFVAVLRLRQRMAEAHREARQLRHEFRSWAERTEAEQRRLRGAVEREHRAAADRQRELLRGIASEQKATAESVRQVGNHLVRRQRDQTRELEALLQLLRGFEPRAPMPSSGHWALNPTDLLELSGVVDRIQPKLVVELGSGTSSTWLGYAVERYGGRLISIDHDADYREQTVAQLRRHGLAEVVEVRHAPLRPVDVAGEPYLWYDLAAFADLSGVDLLLVDGPPGDTGPRARYPALPLLEDRLATPAVVVLDDADRRDETEILRGWGESFKGLAREPGTLGHLAVLAYHR